MGIERRQDKRQDLVSNIEVFNLEDEDLLGYLENISTGGMMLSCQQALSLN